MEIELVKHPKPPEFNNSAGRLIRLLEMLGPRANYFEVIAEFYSPEKIGLPGFQGRAYLEFMILLGRSFDTFIKDVETSPAIPELTRNLIKEGLSGLIQFAFTNNPTSQPRKLQDAELAIVRLAGTMLEMEPEFEKSDFDSVRESIEALRKELENSDLKKSARDALLELVRLTRNALDHYSIHGARGFKKAFKKMLSELMEVYVHEGKEVTKTGWWNTAMGHLKTVDSVAGKLLKYKPVIQEAGKLFISSQD